jgi:hypothetical protein
MKNHRKQVINTDNIPPVDISHNPVTLTTSISSSSLSSGTAANIESTNIKLEQNRQEQLKLIEDMKEMVIKTCLPALDHLRKQAATTTGNVQQPSMIATSGGTTPAATATPLAGTTQISQLTVIDFFVFF